MSDTALIRRALEALEAERYSRPDGSVHNTTCGNWVNPCRYSCELTTRAIADLKERLLAD